MKRLAMTAVNAPIRLAGAFVASTALVSQRRVAYSLSGPRVLPKGVLGAVAWIALNLRAKEFTHGTFAACSLQIHPNWLRDVSSNLFRAVPPIVFLTVCA